MASARRTGTNENVSTYGVSRDYSSLTTWETDTDNDLVTATQSEVLECYADSSTFTDSIYMSGATTNSSYFRIIRPASGEGHDGTPNTGVRFTTTDGECIYVEESNVSIQDLVATTNGTHSNIDAAFFWDVGTNVQFVGCIAVDCLNGGTGDGGGFALYGSDVKIGGAIDCIAVNCDDYGFRTSDSTDDVYVYNCTAIGSVAGFDSSSGAAYIKNCLADGNTTDFTGTWSSSSVANASSDATAPGDSPVTSMTFTFVDAANDDYHLANTDYGALQRGLDLSSDATFAFDDDVDGDTILVWSIGADAQATHISSRRRGVGENVSTYGGGGRDYTSLSNWEIATDNDLVTAKQSEVLECYADSASFDDRIAMGGATTDASYRRVVRPAVGEEHDGTPSAGFILAPTTGSAAVQLAENYVIISDIVATITGSDAVNLWCFLSSDSSDESLFAGCIAFDPVNSGAGDGQGFVLTGGGARTIYFVNCLAVNCEGEGFRVNQASCTGYFYNCTSVKSDNGICQTGGTAIATNCLSNANTTADFDGTFTESYNASGDGTAAGTGSRTSQTFRFVNATNDDYHLTLIDTGALGFGTSMAADSVFPFNDDIDGDTITTWSIGYHSEPTVASPQDELGTANMLLYRRRRRW